GTSSSKNPSTNDTSPVRSSIQSRRRFNMFGRRSAIVGPADRAEPDTVGLDARLETVESARRRPGQDLTVEGKLGSVARTEEELLLRVPVNPTTQMGTRRRDRRYLPVE